MAQVLGRVTGRGLDGPRGPDVSHRIKVPRAWLDQGSLIEVELPRHLRCVACDGGGCDACERSGAITVRGRADPAEIIEVTLPGRGTDSQVQSRPFMIRIPEQGGLPPVGTDVPRGNLLLGVVAADAPDVGVTLIRRSLPAPEPVAARLSSRPPAPRPGIKPVVIIFVVVVLWVLLLLYLRLSGRA